MREDDFAERTNVVSLLTFPFSEFLLLKLGALFRQTRTLISPNKNASFSIFFIRVTFILHYDYFPLPRKRHAPHALP